MAIPNGRTSIKKIIKPVADWSPDGSNRSAGWHSPAIRVGDLVFLSGFLGIYPGTDKLAPSVEEQVRLIFQHIRTSLEAHGASLNDVVQMTTHYTDRRSQAPIVDKVRRELFPKDPPASTGVGVTELNLGAAVEITAIAVITS